MNLILALMIAVPVFLVCVVGAFTAKCSVARMDRGMGAVLFAIVIACIVGRLIG